jgi:hypothetical protein
MDSSKGHEMKLNATRNLRTLATRCKLLGLAAALALGFCAAGANAAHASNTPAPSNEVAQPPHVTIIPDANPIWLAPGLTQGTGGVLIQPSGGPGTLTICVNHGGQDIPIASTPVVGSHQQFPVFSGQPNTVKVYWFPMQQGAMPCAAGGQILVATYELAVYQAGHGLCILCVSAAQTGTLLATAP